MAGAGRWAEPAEDHKGPGREQVILRPPQVPVKRADAGLAFASSFANASRPPGSQQRLPGWSRVPSAHATGGAAPTSIQASLPRDRPPGMVGFVEGWGGGCHTGTSPRAGSGCPASILGFPFHFVAHVGSGGAELILEVRSSTAFCLVRQPKREGARAPLGARLARVRPRSAEGSSTACRLAVRHEPPRSVDARVDLLGMRIHDRARLSQHEAVVRFQPSNEPRPRFETERTQAMRRNDFAPHATHGVHDPSVRCHGHQSF